MSVVRKRAGIDFSGPEERARRIRHVKMIQIEKEKELINLQRADLSTISREYFIALSFSLIKKGEKRTGEIYHYN